MKVKKTKLPENLYHYTAPIKYRMILATGKLLLTPSNLKYDNATLHDEPLFFNGQKDKLDLQTVQQTEHEEKLRSIQDSKRYLYEQYALGEIDLETYRTRKAVYDTELVQAKNVHAVITAQTKQIKSDYEIKLKQQEIVQKVGNANMLTKALIDRLINKVYVFPGDRIEIEYATQDFLETKESEKEV